MKRFTEKHYSFPNLYYLRCADGCDADIDCVDCPNHEALIDLLGEYEDIGLTPEEINDALHLFSCYKRGWISVDDRMPEIDTPVLIAYRGYNPPHSIRADMVAYYAESGYWHWYDGMPISHGEEMVIPDVTHWMPLPEPPED